MNFDSHWFGSQTDLVSSCRVMTRSSPRADLQSCEAEREGKRSSGRKWSGFGCFSRTRVTVAGSSLERALAELEVKTAAHVHLWGLDTADWSVKVSAAEITFTGENVQAMAPMQIVGTYNTQDGTWLWGWDHPSVPAPCAQAAGAVREFAGQHRLTALQDRKIQCSEADAWAFTALAAQLTEAQGAYRGPTSTALVFMTFGKVSLSSREENA